MGETIAPGTYRGGSGLQDTISTMLGIQKIKAAKEATATDEAVKTSLARKRLEEERKGRKEESKGIFAREVEGAFGAAPSPEIEPYIAPSRQLYESEGAVTAPLFTKRDPAEGINLINRPVTLSDVRPSLRRGAEEFRQEELGKAKRLPPSAEPEAVGAEIKARKIPAAAGAVAAEQSKLRSEGAKATQEETKAKLGAQTLEAEVSEKKSTASIRAIEAGAAEETAALNLREKRAKTLSAEVDATYAEIFKQTELEIKEREITLKDAEIRKEPLDYENARLDIETKKQNLAKGKIEAQREARIAALRSQYEGESDPKRRTEILKQLAVENGHEATLITEDVTRANAYVSAIESGQKMFLTAQAAIANNDIEGTSAALDSYNNTMIQAALLRGSNTVRLQTVQPVEGVVYGATVTPGSVIVPTDVAVAWKDGTLDQAITGKIRGIDPGWALAQKIRIEHAYGQGNKAVFESAINSATADPVVKQRALQLLQVAEGKPTEKKKEKAPETKPKVGVSRGLPGILPRVTKEVNVQRQQFGQKPLPLGKPEPKPYKTYQQRVRGE